MQTARRSACSNLSFGEKKDHYFFSFFFFFNLPFEPKFIALIDANPAPGDVVISLPVGHPCSAEAGHGLYSADSSIGSIAIIITWLKIFSVSLCIGYRK